MVHFTLPFQILVFCCCAVCSAEISCKNEEGEPVDWFIIYKLPRYVNGDIGSGVEYMYLDSSKESWEMSKYMINSSQGAIANTLNQLYMGKEYKFNTSVYALYNDAPPVLKYIQQYGHTKGALLFDRSQGFWLSHSIPHFPSFPERGYLYPSSGKVNGQTALCVTYQYQEFLHIATQLVYLYPRFYNCSVPAAFLADLPQLAQLCAGAKPQLSSNKRMEQLFSAGGEKFVSFVKSENFVDDIYTGWVAQTLGADLLVESWQTQGHDLPSNCSLPKHTMNIKRIQFPRSVLFHSHNDHSKWCVSRLYEDQVTCLGDLNRERGQLWRGGGLICSFNPLIYKAFREVVDWYIGCTGPVTDVLYLVFGVNGVTYWPDK
uniref:deoxyribonuclease II n=1 Tax=Amphilophus citrinellus TaxID=61819 RepID=A0A3Q0S5Y7_AMPCI